jgi:hypothetical protein
MILLKVGLPYDPVSIFDLRCMVTVPGIFEIAATDFVTPPLAPLATTIWDASSPAVFLHQRAYAPRITGPLGPTN